MLRCLLILSVVFMAAAARAEDASVEALLSLHQEAASLVGQSVREVGEVSGETEGVADLTRESARQYRDDSSQSELVRHRQTDPGSDPTLH